MPRGGEISDYYTDCAEETIVNKFASGFTSSGYENGLVMYIVEKSIGITDSIAGNYAFNNIPEEAAGYINIIGQSAVGGLFDYYAGIEDATVIENTFNELDINNMYAHLGFYAVPIGSDTSEGQTNIQYVQTGTNSIELIESFNETSGENIKINGVIYYPQESANTMNEYYGDGKQNNGNN